LNGPGVIGLLAGSGQLPVLFARAARAQGLQVHAVAFSGDTAPALASEVASLTWLKLGQVRGMARALTARGVTTAVMAGGIGRLRAMRDLRPDLGALQVLARLRGRRDDELLKAVAGYLEAQGVRIVAPTDYATALLAAPGHLAGPALTAAQRADVALGREVAAQLGRADVGQTVVVREGHVLAVEAVEGTDECIRRAGRYGGPGAVVVKRSKPGQDRRFDLPAAGPVTLEVMREAGARVLAVEAGATVLLDAEGLFHWAPRLQISVVAFDARGVIT
jgi:DUF1009 family protein